MDLILLSALMFCWAGGMIMGAAIMYGIVKQQDPKPDLTVEAEEVTLEGNIDEKDELSELRSSDH